MRVWQPINVVACMCAIWHLLFSVTKRWPVVYRYLRMCVYKHLPVLIQGTVKESTIMPKPIIKLYTPILMYGTDLLPKINSHVAQINSSTAYMLLYVREGSGEEPSLSDAMLLPEHLRQRVRLLHDEFNTKREQFAAGPEKAMADLEGRKHVRNYPSIMSPPLICPLYMT